MSSSIQEVHSRRLREIAADYEARGYRVLVEPSPTELPEFLGGFHPDLVALGPQDSVIVEVKVGTQTAASGRFRDLAEVVRQQPGWRFSLVVIDPRSDEVAPSARRLLDRDEIVDRLGQAEGLLRADSEDAAFLLLWISTEALLRHIAIREGLPLEQVPSSALVKELFSLGILSRSDLDIAQRALSVRNSLVHGFGASGFDQVVGELARLAHQLLEESDRSSDAAE